ncbi:asparagine synthase (glutamine-hydrolyzing) [Gammaproteobacteria bacterium]|nr:asparagine synthase (glutamine-hydrolyzing) [Gammaproteobacteria bacterium]
MSGIFGKAGNIEDITQVLMCMSNALAHRGPNDEAQYTSAKVGLGCRRLSIQDLQGGRQPLSNEDGDIWVVCNGEIYNADSLRQSLEENHHTFRTRSDAEVIVHLYEEQGTKCVEKLRGMFAFALWDEGRQQLVLARDHLGQKPIFYAHTDKSLYFASEVKAITAARSERPELDYGSLYHYLSLRFIPESGTMIRDIKKLPPAHFLVYRNDNTELSRYWHPSFLPKTDLSDEDYIEGLREKLQETVASHLVGEVPIGAFLSGGLDSGLIVAMMANTFKQSFPTFTVGVANKEFDEVPYARIVSDTYGTRQFETYAEIDLVRSLPEIIRHLDEPSDPVAASKFLASRLAAKHVKVVLGGDGGDELFAGFDRYLGVRDVKYYAAIPSVIRNKLIAPLVDRIPASFGYDSIALKLRWIERLADIPSVAERFSEAVSFFRFRPGEKRKLFSETTWQQVKHLSTSSILCDKFSESDTEEIIEQMLYTDYTTRLPEHSLMLTDRLSMAYGLEVRSPLVDKELVEYVAKFPLRLKIRRRRAKYVERKLAERELPKGVAGRRKRGFRFPIASWFGNQLYPFLSSLFADSSLVRDGIFRQEYIVQLLNEHHRRYIDHHVRIWMLLNLEIWYRLVIKQNDLSELEEWVEKHLTKV